MARTTRTRTYALTNGRGVIDTNQFPTEEVRASNEYNGTNSGLLKLPAEIRNRIFSYVLGGKHFHITGALNGTEVVLMHRMIPATNSGLPGHPGDLPYRQQRQTGSTSSDKYILNLLFVCREIYREYCHFQYCSNVFSFSSECIFQDFMEKRTRVQKEAIWEVAVTFPTAKRYGRQLKELKKVHYGAYFPSVERATVQAQEWAGKSVEVIAWAGRFPGRPS